MRLGVVIKLALLAITAPTLVFAQTQQGSAALKSIANRAWPAFEAGELASLAPLAPADALKTFYAPPGYHLELVAAEPLVRDPILMEFDPDGRLWVLEMPAWAYNEKMENSLEPMNQLVILEDMNSDGVYDKRTVFMDKLILPRAFKILDGNCALVGEPPNLWKACDSDGDLVSDKKELIADSFGTLGILEHGANGLYWGMDNLIHVAEHNWNLAYENGKFRTAPSLRRGQWGVTQDDGGRIYRNVNTDPLFVDYVEAKYFVRNPNVVRTKGHYESLVKQEETLIWPAHPTPGLNRGYRKEVFRDDGSATYYGGVSSPLIYRGDKLPKEVRGQPFVADGPTNIVHLLDMKDDGTGHLSASDFYKKGEFLSSTDVRFRPTALSGGWDGSIYIVDMYRGVSQDGPLQTDYLRSFINQRGLAKGVGYGRIYRVVYDGMSFDKKPSMSRETPAQLVAHLSHTNGWWRDTAQQLLVQRNDKSVVPALRKLAATSPDWRTRLHALWTLNGMGSLDPKDVVEALEDQAPDIRGAALRMSEPWLASGDKAVRKAVLARMNDGNWAVRRRLAASLGELPADARAAPLLALLGRYGDDQITVDAAVSSLAGLESYMLQRMLKQPKASPDALAMLAGAAAKGRDPSQTLALVAAASDETLPQATRVALLEGIGVGLKGGGASGGNIVAGGRAGGGIPGVVRRATGPNRFELPVEPTHITSLVAGTGPLSAAARAVVDLVTWPGRPAQPAVAARTPEEERLFFAGKTLYQASCSGCHQNEGQGSPGIAPALAGSKRVLANGDMSVRILTNGFEGKIGLMPPLGAAMNDDELAGLLTFIRQSWGNSGSPISPAGVKEWRTAYAHRATPWSETEIDAPQR